MEREFEVTERGNEGIMKELAVGDLMSQLVLSVKQSDNLADVYDIMSENHIRHLPVVDDDDQVIGLVSHRDLLASALYTDQVLPVSEVQDFLRTMMVREIMVRGVETVTAEDSAAEAGRTMLENKFGCLPVVEGNTLVGILTESDFIRHVIDFENALAKETRALSA